MENISTLDYFQSIESKNELFFGLFWASWYENDSIGKQIKDICDNLAIKYQKQNIKFYLIDTEADSLLDLVDQYRINVVPTFICWKGKQEVHRLESMKQPSDIQQFCKDSMEKSTKLTAIVVSDAKMSINIREKLLQLTHSASVMLFMKGKPAQPKCGFSRQIVEILNKHNIKFQSFDILEDEEVRQNLKIFSDWPTFPQLYVSGNFVGGLDIVKEIDSNYNSADEFCKELGIIEIQPPSTFNSLQERLVKLTTQAPVVLFMKGSPDSPKCGFSKTICGILDSEGISMSTFDILEDEEVRQRLKEYSDWPTFPQLYVNGNFVGGLDIVKDMIAQNGPLKPQLGI